MVRRFICWVFGHRWTSQVMRDEDDGYTYIHEYWNRRCPRCGQVLFLLAVLLWAGCQTPGPNPPPSVEYAAK